MDPILNPTIFLGPFEWREPVTTLTDFLIGLVAWYAFYRMQTYVGKKPDNFKFYKYYFLCLAIGMTSAAWFGHGFQAYVGPRMKAIGWCMNATALLMLAWASAKEVESLLPKWGLKSIQIWLVLQYIIFISLVVNPVSSDFIYSQINSTIILILFILPMHIYNYWETKKEGSFLVFSTVLFGILPGLTYNIQFSFSRWFNYHDVSHTLIVIFTYLMYRAVRRITGMEDLPIRGESKVSVKV